jgi:hypothetical protein
MPVFDVKINLAKAQGMDLFKLKWAVFGELISIGRWETRVGKRKIAAKMRSRAKYLDRKRKTR